MKNRLNLFIIFLVFVGTQSLWASGLTGQDDRLFVAKMAEACVDGNENARILTEFQVPLAKDENFLPMLTSFCAQGGTGQVFTIEVNFEKTLVNGAVTLPQAAIYLNVRKMPNLNRNSGQAIWSIDPDVKNSIEYLMNPGQNPKGFFPFDVARPIAILMVAPKNNYFSAAVVSGDDALDSAIRTIPGNENCLSAMLVGKGANLDILAHEYQHVMDKQPGSGMNQLQDDLQKLSAWTGADLTKVSDRLREHSAYDSQIKFLSSPGAREKKEWCYSEEGKSENVNLFCLPVDEYIPARIDALLGKLKLYKLGPVSSVSAGCEAKELIQQAFSGADARLLEKLVSTMPRKCEKE